MGAKKPIKASSAAADAVVAFATSRRQMKRAYKLVYYDLAIAAVLPMDGEGGPLCQTIVDVILRILAAGNRVHPYGGALIDGRGVTDLLAEIDHAQREIHKLAVEMGLIEEAN